CTGDGAMISGSSQIIRCIIAKNGGSGLNVTNNSALLIHNNTVDGNTSYGLSVPAGALPQYSSIFNNIFSNHTSAAAVNVTSGVLATVDVGKFMDYNSFYNNLSNYSGISPGAHDTQLTSDPYVDAATQNYTLV
ncbi:MAG: right-handed parallel beta-helix repeat-containing protein, partial [Bradyrhizobium sp.]|nr:right-handed parallel beta-helix repeat-containing protein [Bradyrhizobium sp.]